MAEYTYTRTLDSETNLYNIDYDGETINLSKHIKTNFPNSTLIKTECKGTELKVIIEPALSGAEKITLDDLVANH